MTNASPLERHIDGIRVRRCPYSPKCPTITQNGTRGEARHIDVVHDGDRPAGTAAE